MKLLLTRTDLQTIGTRVIGAIIDNTSKGIDRFGKPFRKYSIKPFAMPYPAYLNFSTKASIKRNKKNESVSYFKRDGALFVVIKGGYNALKKERFQTGDNTVNLQVRGARGGGMLGELVTGDIKENSITVKFKTSETADLAYYHTVAGVGKSKVIRDFLGLPPSQLAEIENEIANKIKFIYP